MQIKVVPLGAGQDVGKSCILVTMGGKNILLDSGMHPGYNDERRFPDFRYISREGNMNGLIDLVIISHFHLDHCGSLPYFTEICGYSGPIYATHPTKAIMPILLEDYRKISVERRGVDEKDFFTSQMIKDCMLKITPCALEETIVIEPDFEIRAYYAGHVLGAAMFYVRVGQQSFVYTGDYNMTPDRHLGSANCDRLRPDLLITESTYATTIRDSKRCRERDLLRQVSECVREGGKVLIPVFALGRAQELCLLLDAFWERTGLDVPIYFSAGLTERANWYYKMFIGWTNQKIKNTFVKRNVFDFVHIRPFDRALVDTPGPMVLFATPGMLHGGLSSDVFKRWAPNANNLVIMPGYCVAGTLGHKVLSNGGKPQVIDLDRSDGGGKLHVRCKIKHMSFSAHADAKGIMTLIKRVDPKAVMLVHGERQKMQFLKQRINDELGLPCYDPANGSTCYINTPHPVPVLLSSSVLAKRDRGGGRVDKVDELRAYGGGSGGMFTKRQLAPTATFGLEGVLSIPDAKSVRLLQDDAAAQVLRVPKCDVVFKHSMPLSGVDGPEGPVALAMVLDGLQPKLEKELGMRATRTEPPEGEDTSSAGSVPPPLFMLLVSSLVLTVSDGSLSFEWGHHQEDLAHRAWAIISSSLALPPGLLPLKSSRSLTFPPASPMFSPTSPNYNPPSPDYTPTNDALEQSRSEPMMPTSPSEAPPPTPGAKRPKIKMENE